MNEQITVEEMGSAAECALALDRAAGCKIPKHETLDLIYKLAFAAGAKWATQRAHPEVKI